MGPRRTPRPARVSVTFHAEAAQAPVRLARELRARGVRAGLAAAAGDPVEPFLDLLPEFDMMLVMTVEPGFGGQSFLDGLPAQDPPGPRRRSARPGWTSGSRSTAGSSAATIERCAEAGADVFVAGSAVYGARRRRRGQIADAAGPGGRGGCRCVTCLTFGRTVTVTRGLGGTCLACGMIVGDSTNTHTRAPGSV